MIFMEAMHTSMDEILIKREKWLWILELKLRDTWKSPFTQKQRYSTATNTLLLEEKVINSLGMLELISFVEETFSIEVPDEDIIPEHFGTIEKLTRYVESHVNGIPLVCLRKNEGRYFQFDNYFSFCLEFQVL